MPEYKGIFMRSALRQGNQVPRQGPQNTSPDILLSGIAPVADQNIFAQHYEEAFDQPLLAQQANYIYLRGKNYDSQPIEDSGDNQPRLFWTRASLLLWPQTWTELTTVPSGEKFSLKANPGLVGVTNRPFVWIPYNLDNDHYCLIAFVPSPGYDNNVPQDPLTNFNAWAAERGGVACTDVRVTNTNVVTIAKNAMSFDMGSEPADIQFSIICDNLPLGCTISFSAGTPGTHPALYLAPTIVTTSPKFTAGVKCFVPGGYVSDIYFNLVVPSGSISGARVRIMAAYAPEDGQNNVLGSAEFTL